MFAQGGGHSQYRTGGQSGLFSTPQQSSSFSSSYNQANSATTGAAASSSVFGGSSSTFAGPQFGGGNHGAAFGAGGQFGGSTASGHQSTGAGGAYGSPYGAGGAGHAESSPQNNADDRAWDSPARKASLSGSPVTRYGGGSLFGRESGTPSKSPRMSSYTAPPRKSAYRQEIEEDAPPVASLNEFESGDYAADSGSRLATSHDPTASPFAAASAPLPSHSTAHSKEGYSVYVFGFPAAATDLVLDFFTPFGEIVSTTPSTEGGNWVTITYAQAWSAARAARKNGEILGGALMVGVKAVDEDGLRRALAGAEGGQDLVPSAPSATPVPRQNGNAGGGATSTPSGVGRPVNVLGPQSAFKAAPTPTRKGFLGLGGGGATAPSTPSGADPHASLFAEKSKQAALAQQPQQKGVLGKVSDMVFGW
ncbi:hypothetical protein C6P46_002609 [Rhodotorula mucilaginosa]|uniref:RRM Nup35-type domain-containing protein n=1 Tax=Rhodotorula mucilaginosa TaxID=5537 RepID=A0A9P6W8M4_RHOMI|nr:hypothetical protein C6P46_002609 [Rhodotorula mucilaginosa]TKA55171.1 hypothetical protein B0A53_02141 [Rhodotorula sp. CCFEE 5036]